MIRLHALYDGDSAKCTIEAISGISGNFWALLDQAKAGTFSSRGGHGRTVSAVDIQADPWPQTFDKQRLASKNRTAFPAQSVRVVQVAIGRS